MVTSTIFQDLLLLHLQLFLPGIIEEHDVARQYMPHPLLWKSRSYTACSIKDDPVQRNIDLRRRGLSGHRYYTLTSKVEITYPCIWKSMIWRANSTHVCATYMLPESCRCSSDPSVGALSLLSGSQQTPVAVGKGKGGWVTSSLTVSTTICSTAS